MRTFGLIGKSLGHSWSKSYFDKRFEENDLSDCIYRNYTLQDVSEFSSLVLREASLVGLNVTTPFKSDVIRLLDRLDPLSNRIQAVNVIKIRREGESVFSEGFNTDGPAFLATIVPLLKAHHKKALILGTGGASRAVAWGLRENKLEYIMVSRSRLKGDLTYFDLSPEIIRDHQLIINATPLGMFPESECFPDIPYDALTRDHLLYDLIYNPELTVFLRNGIKAGATVKNGLEMLHLQAELSWKLWQ